MGKYESHSGGGYHSKKSSGKSYINHDKSYIKDVNTTSEDIEELLQDSKPKEKSPIVKKEKIYKEPEFDNSYDEFEDDEIDDKPKKTKPGVIIVLIILLIIALAAVAFAVYTYIIKPNQSTKETTPTFVETIKPATKQQATTPTESAEEKLNKQVNAYVSNMTNEEKIYQMFIVDPDTLTEVPNSTEVGEITKDALKKHPVGGFIFLDENIESSTQLTKMIKDLQSASSIPLFISVDEEGGDVARCEDNLDVAVFDNMFTYKSEGTQTATKNAKQIATDISKLGFNLDFAPVADVWTNNENTVIGERAYSDDYKEASDLVGAAVKGFESGGVMTTLKHFPGHGSTVEDSHTEFAHLTLSKSDIISKELLPFKSGIAAGADMVMVGHIIVDDMDKEYPATMSSVVVPELLRKELNYQGIAISDALNMSSITDSTYETSEIVTKLINDATVDILLMPNDIDAYATAINDAIKNGKIKQSTIDNSVAKIIKLKAQKNLIKLEETNTNTNKKTTETVKSTTPTSETKDANTPASPTIN